jgi:TatD DNase family protein
MRWFDTHCHLDRMPEGIKPRLAMQHAQAVGVERLVVPGVSGAPLHAARLLAISGVEVAWGVHPDYIGDYKRIGSELEPWARARYMPVAIGECGLDRRCRFSIEEQKEVFVWQLDLAARHRLPVIIHLVGHYQLAYDILTALPEVPTAVLHSWSGSPEMAKRFVAAGAFVSISGGHLRRPEKLVQLLAALPLSSLLLETDAPDMAAPSWSGFCNEPAALPEIGAAVAEKAGIAVEKLCEILYNNSVRIFGQGKQKQNG